MTKPKGLKYDQGKPRPELIPALSILEISKVLAFGAKKYEEWNWTEDLTYSRISGACLRHLFYWLSGEDKDKETGISHLAHAGCCVLFLLHLEQTRKDLDDRFKVIQTEEKNDERKRQRSRNVQRQNSSSNARRSSRKRRNGKN